MPKTKLYRSGLALVALLAVLAGNITTANAVSDAVKKACADDYFKFCPSYAVGSNALAQCMRKSASKLSNKCKNALR